MTVGMNNVDIVVESLDDAVAFFAELAQLVGEVVHYEEAYRLCYLRGPEGILIGLAQEVR